MTTVEEARHTEDSWEIIGKLVNKRVFCMKNKKNEPVRMMSLTIIDSDGVLIDIQTWSKTKVYCLYRKMIPNQAYVIQGNGRFETPNKVFSTSKYLYSRWWWIEKADDQFRLRNYVPVSVNLDKTISILSQGQPVNILGRFFDLNPGPVKNGFNKPFIQGYYVGLLDDRGYRYRVLVWHVNTIKGNKFPLLAAGQNDDVLITCARSSYLDPNAEGGDRIYTLTSVVPPVLNSECISYKRRQDLRKSQ